MRWYPDEPEKVWILDEIAHQMPVARLMVSLEAKQR
jgi:hypothetical protein